MWVTNGVMAVELVPPGLTSLVPMAAGALLAPYLDGVNSCSPNPEKVGEAVSQHIKGGKAQRLLPSPSPSPALSRSHMTHRPLERRAEGKALILSHRAPQRSSVPPGLDPSWPRAESGFPAQGGAWLAATPSPACSRRGPGPCSLPEPRWRRGGQVRASLGLCGTNHHPSGASSAKSRGAGGSPASGKVGLGSPDRRLSGVPTIPCALLPS